MSNVQVKPVPLGVSLDYHEKLLHTVGKKIKSTRTKLHETELLLNLQPPDDEPENYKKWQDKVHTALSTHEEFQFPSLNKMQQEFVHHKLMRQQSRIRKYGTDDEMNQRANAILAKQTENMKKKVLEGRGKFGSSIKGEVLRVVPNYRGLNSHFTESRTLIRKDGRRIPENCLESSLPPWIGPQYYELNYDPTIKGETSYQVAFRALPRYAVSSEVVKRTKILERKKQLNDLSQSMSLQEHNQSFADSLDGSWKSLFDDEDWKVIQKKKEALMAGEEMDLKEDLVGDDDVLFDGGALEDDDLEEAMAAKKAQEKLSMTRYRTYTEDDLDAAIRSVQEEALQHQQLMNEGSIEFTTSHTSSFITLSNSADGSNEYILPPLEASSSPTKSPGRKSHPPLAHKQGPIDMFDKEKLAIQQEYQLKIINAEKNYYDKRWKPRDYTMNALANQLPFSLDTYSLGDDFLEKPKTWIEDRRGTSPKHSRQKKTRSSRNGSPTSVDGDAEGSIITAETTQFPSHSDHHSRTSSPSADQSQAQPEQRKSRFTSSIFTTKPALFRTSGELLAVKNKQKEAANNKSSSSHSTSRPGTRARTATETSVQLDGDHMNAQHQQSISTVLEPGAQGQDLLQASSHTTMLLPFNTTTQLTTLHSSSSPLNSRPPSSSANHRTMNMSASMPALSSSASASYASHASISNASASHQSISPSMDTKYSNKPEVLKTLLKQKESTSKTLKNWYKQEGIKRAVYTKVGDGEKWLNEHPTLPSIALSLNGLLLEHNPFNGRTFESAFEIPKS